MALKDAYILNEDRAVSPTQWSAQAIPGSSNTAMATDKAASYAPSAIPAENPAAAPADRSQPQAGTLNLSIEEWHMLADMVGEHIDGEVFNSSDVYRILSAVRSVLQKLQTAGK